MNTPLVEILVGEDNPADARLISLFLETWDFPTKLTCFPSGRKFQAYLESRESNSLPLIIFLDFFLTEVEGPKILKWIRDKGLVPDAPVILMSGSYLEEVMERAYTFGGNYFLEKSIDPDRFFDEMRGILNFLIRTQSIKV